MGRTLPSITRAFLAEQESFVRFRRALRRSDQHALDDLFAAAHQRLHGLIRPARFVSIGATARLLGECDERQNGQGKGESTVHGALLVSQLSQIG